MKSSRGMTLIELSVVMLLIMMAASLTLPLFTGIAQSTRNQITEARVTQIKQAIINVQTVNGTPTVSGFVADVGRLPYCIQELINGTCPIAGIPLNASWKGPYLQTSDGTFYDGWGNLPNATTTPQTNSDNFGWNYQVTSQKYQQAPTSPVTHCPLDGFGAGDAAYAAGPCDTLSLQSFGADGVPDTALTNLSSGSYDNDYPPSIGTNTPSHPGTLMGMPVLIQPSDWIIDLSTTGLNVQFNHPVSVIQPPTISTTCTLPAPTSPVITNPFTSNVAYSTCPVPDTLTTISSTSTITCPAGYTANAPAVVGAATSSITITCNPPIPSIATSTALVNCLNGLMLAPSSVITSSFAPVVAVCTGRALSIAAPVYVTNTTTTFTTTECASGSPTTLFILANDLYGNSIIPAIPTPSSVPLLGAPLLLPSTCNQFNAINYSDLIEAESGVPAPTPMSVGNWTVCAFQSSILLPTFTWGTFPVFSESNFPLSYPYSSCSSAVTPASPEPGILYLSPVLNSALYSATITVLPRTQPSIAW